MQNIRCEKPLGSADRTLRAYPLTGLAALLALGLAISGCSNVPRVHQTEISTYEKTSHSRYSFAGEIDACWTSTANRGCAGDQDGDGIPDTADKCADTPRGYASSSSGCPSGGVKVLTAARVYFVHNQSDLTPRQQFRVQVFARELTEKHGDLDSIELQVTGHTDTSGRRDANQRLSLDRAHQVRNKLYRWLPASVSILVDGKGQTQPVTKGQGADERAENRRVDIAAYRLREPGEKS